MRLRCVPAYAFPVMLAPRYSLESDYCHRHAILAVGRIIETFSSLNCSRFKSFVPCFLYLRRRVNLHVFPQT